MPGSLARKPVSPLNTEARGGVNEGEDERGELYVQCDQEVEKEGAIDEEEGYGAKAGKTPAKPTKADVDGHELAHIPFRDWCVFSQKGRGRQQPHRQRRGEENVRSNVEAVFHMDYMYLTEGTGEMVVK